MAKARDAFRTISEVSEWLDTPAHVLRFWESKFTQVKPVKRAGGRRYYRPDDMALLGGIKALLHEQGMTIKGAQKLLREKGVKHVASLADTLDGSDTADAKAPETKAVSPVIDVTPVVAEAEVETTDAPEKDAAATPMAPAMPPPMRPSIELVAAVPDTAPEDAVAAPMAPADDVVAAPEMPPAPPAMPLDAQPATPRFLGLLQSANRTKMQAHAADITPLLARLEEVRDRMRAS